MSKPITIQKLVKEVESLKRGVLMIISKKTEPSQFSFSFLN
ncbi:MAG: hypothetical protein AB1765_07025 [Candidatus Hydrogenedentota bacterium]